ncbi:radical SAM protein [Geotalea toluenoxydans]|uniref:radical SAM protein n=1 Tax=Geotalea toluenoxydans TaxID=421624 RepID=UPI000A66E5DE|nr:radical SAM protein [Geotalea toluenoxydans]
MSSLERGVRSFSMERIRSDLGILMAKEVKTVKLVDRTFNYDVSRANEIWDYILHNNRGSRFHFEIAADLLTEENLALLAKVPQDTFRFEIGIQSKDTETLERVGRSSDLDKLFINVARLRQETQVTIHLDLVAGLPGEDYQGFLRSLQVCASSALTISR